MYRLEQYHHEIDLDYNQDGEHSRKPIKLNMKIFRRYIFTISLLIGVGLLLYFLTVYVFYENTDFFLLYRLKFINFLISRRTNIYQISYYAIEIIADSNSHGLFQRFDNLSVFPDYMKLYKNNDYQLTVLRGVLLESDVKKNMPQEIFDIYYTNSPSTNYLHYGVCSGFSFLRRYYQLIINTLGTNQLDGYLSSIDEFISVYTSLFTISEYNSKTQISNQLNILIYFVICSLVFLIIVTFAYFLPFFTKEQRILENIDMLMKVFNFSFCTTIKSKEITKNKL